MKYRNLLITVALAVFLAIACESLEVRHINNNTAEISLKKGQTLIMPMSDNAPSATFTEFDSRGTRIGEPWTALFAVEKSDYCIPYTALQDITLRIEGLSFESVFFKEVRLGKAKAYNPAPFLHFKPAFGWTNDPNGMFYKDGEWHLYYQHNPYGSKWANMSWGHAVTKDLVHWEHRAEALLPDGLGMIFSGSAAVDGDDVIAMYTSAGARQVQSIAVSHDGGDSFEKYSGNPVLESATQADFRDPKLFRYEPDGRWRVIIAAGDAMEIYSSDNLYDWTFESRFGEGVGCHGGVWECPDLFPLEYNGEQKWVLISSCMRDRQIGQATQYFIGSFDGHEFIPDDVQERWSDYGRDHYAAVTWNGDPEGRKILLAWLSNWMYADKTNTVGYRGMMTTPRELSLVQYNGRLVMAAYPPAVVLDAIPSSMVEKHTVTCESPEIKVGGITIRFDFAKSLFSMERSDGTTWAELKHSPRHEILIIKADNAVECFVDGGAVCMTCLDM